MKTLLSIFDHSGVWSAPFRHDGWQVHQWDIKLSEFMDINLIDSAETALDLFENVDGIIAAPPCTDFTCSGNQYWKIKDEDGRTHKSVELVAQVERLADLFRPTDPGFYEDGGTFFWAAENPVGRIAKITGLGQFDAPLFFDPYEYAGHLHPSKKVLAELDRVREKNGQNVTAEECELIVKWNAYTKKTGLWGQFNHDLVKKPIAPVKAAPQGSFTQRYGGKSDRTKEARSVTPYGFALAFYEANKDYQAPII